MVNYQDGKIYKLVGGGLTYYGSTCDELYKRLYGHKQKSNSCKSKQLFDTGDKVEIILVEKYPCNDKMELQQRERYYIENNECVNKVIPTRTKKEHYKDNKDTIIEKHKEYLKEYYEYNKDKIKEQTKIYNENNKEKIKERRKKYYEDNKDKMNNKMKKYREKNKDRLNEMKKEIINCECGSSLYKCNLSMHKKTKKHIDFINK